MNSIDSFGRILLFAEDPGGANGLMHLSTRFASQGYDSKLYATGFALKYLHSRNIPYLNADEELVNAISDYDALLIGTCENKKTLGFDLVASAKRNRVPSFAFVDASMNSQFRFSGVTDDPKYHSPDLLFCNDDDTKSEFLRLGWSSERIIVSGHPHYWQLQDRLTELNQISKHKQRIALFGENASRKKVVTFMAETLSGFDMSTQCIQDSWTLKGRGVSSLKVLIALEALLDVLQDYFDRNSYHVVLRLHPKNSPDEFKVYQAEVDQISSGGDPLQLAYYSDIVCGVETSLLTEACLLGVKTISIQPDDTTKKHIPAFVRGKMSMPRTKSALMDALKTRRLPSVPNISYPYYDPAGLITRTVREVIATAY
jgi:hypothetical protein